MYGCLMLADRLRDERLSRITGVLNSHHAALVDETVDLMANEDEWVGPGVWTIESYLQWRAGVSFATARQLSTIARRINDLPISVAAFRRGELTLDQMATIARRAPGWLDDQALEYGVSLTVSQLNRVLRDYPFPTFDADGNEIMPDGLVDVTSTPAIETDGDGSPTDEDTAGEGPDSTEQNGTPAEGSEPSATHGDTSPEPDASSDGNDPQVDEYCSYTYGEDGVFRLHLATDFETGNVIRSALDEAHDRLFHASQQPVTMVDAMREVAEASLDTIDDSARSARFKTNVFLETDATATDTAGWTVPDAIRRYITCDGLLSPVFVEQGVPVSVGRSQRIVPDRTRTLIERRDSGCCSVPGCTRTIGLDVHHITHWEHGGDTDTWNLLLVCSHHHRQHHRGRLGITGNADLPRGVDGAVEFTDRTGRRILPSGATPITPMGPIPPSAVRYEHPLGERLRPGSIHFAPPPSSPSPRQTNQPGAA